MKYPLSSKRPAATQIALAAEMVQEFTWTPEDQDVIEAAIQEEVKKLTNDDVVDPQKSGSPEGVHDPSAEITVMLFCVRERPWRALGTYQGRLRCLGGVGSR